MGEKNGVTMPNIEDDPAVVAARQQYEAAVAAAKKKVSTPPATPTGTAKRKTPPHTVSQPPAGPSSVFMALETSNTDLAALVLTEKKATGAKAGQQSAPAVPPPVASSVPGGAKKGVLDALASAPRPSFAASTLGGGKATAHAGGKKGANPKTSDVTKAVVKQGVDSKAVQTPDKRPADAKGNEGAVKKQKVEQPGSTKPPLGTHKKTGGHIEENVIEEGVQPKGRRWQRQCLPRTDFVILNGWKRGTRGEKDEQGCRATTEISARRQGGVGHPGWWRNDGGRYG